MFAPDGFELGETAARHNLALVEIHGKAAAYQQGPNTVPSLKVILYSGARLEDEPSPVVSRALCRLQDLRAVMLDTGEVEQITPANGDVLEVGGVRYNVEDVGINTWGGVALTVRKSNR